MQQSALDEYETATAHIKSGSMSSRSRSRSPRMVSVELVGVSGRRLEATDRLPNRLPSETTVQEVLSLAGLGSSGMVVLGKHRLAATDTLDQGQDTLHLAYVAIPSCKIAICYSLSAWQQVQEPPDKHHGPRDEEWGSAEKSSELTCRVQGPPVTLCMEDALDNTCSIPHDSGGLAAMVRALLDVMIAVGHAAAPHGFGWRSNARLEGVILGSRPVGLFQLSWHSVYGDDTLLWLFNTMSGKIVLQEESTDWETVYKLLSSLQTHARKKKNYSSSCFIESRSVGSAALLPVSLRFSLKR